VTSVSNGRPHVPAAKLVPNPEPKRREAEVFGSWEELERLAEELPPERRSLPILVAGTGLRPEEWIALTRADVDTKAGVLHVRRVYTDGQVKEYGKQSRSIRRVPLRRRSVDALAAHPWRIDTPLVYPDENGGYLRLDSWRRSEWRPALEAAGLPKLPPYAMRHTFASFAIAAGVSLFYLSRLMGTSVDQLDRVYGHPLPESEEYLRGLLDTYDDIAAEAAEGGTR
jgi:integrase